MLKRVISLLMTAAMLVIPYTVDAYTFSDVVDDEAIDFVTSLGIMEGFEDGNFLPEGTVTRGEAAEIISKIINYNREKTAASWDFFGEELDTLLTPDNREEASERYIDVNKNHQYYEEINLATIYGIMIGVSENEFAPEQNLKVKEAIKIVVDFLGYRTLANKNGGYPSGYVKTAADLKLYSSGGFNEDITRGGFAKILYDALDTDMMLAEYKNANIYYTSQKDNTMMSYFMKIDKITGVVIQNNYTSFIGENTIGKDYIQIRTKENKIYTLELDKNTKYVNDYIGRTVDCYYTNEKSVNPDMVVYCKPSRKNTEITIKFDDIENKDSFDGTSIVYEEKDKDKTAKIIDGAYFIVNGKAEGTLPKNILGYDNGTVTLISSTGTNTYDIVIINGYEDWLVSSVDTKETCVYNKLVDKIEGNGDEMLILDENDVDFLITDKNGKTLDFASLSTNMVMSVSRSLDNSIVRIIVCEDKDVDFVVRSVNNVDNTLTGKDKEYDISATYLNSKNYQPIKIGMSYTAYFDNFGKIVWLTQGFGTWITGYVYSFKKIEDEGDPYIGAKVLISDKNFKMYELKEKIKFADVDEEQARTVKSDNIVGTLTEYRGVIRYKLDVDEKITEIELPLKEGFGSKLSDRLYTMLESDVTDRKPDDSNLYLNHFKTFGAKIFVNDEKTRMLSVPDNESDYERYVYINTSSFSSNNSYAFKAYGTDYRNRMAEYLVTKNLSETIRLDDQTQPRVVVDMEQGINEFDEAVTKVKLVSLWGNEEVVFDKLEDGYLDKALGVARTTDVRENAKPVDLHKVEVGDIIRYTKDGEGYFNYIELIFDANGEYDNKQFSEILGTLPDYNFKNVKKGTLAGTIGYFSDFVGNTNPLGDSKLATVTSNNANSIMGGTPRYFLGYVYDFYNGIVTYTNKDLYAGGSAGMDEGRYLTESRSINDIGDIGFVEYDRDRITVRRGGEQDIRSYLDYPGNMSRILVVTAYTDRRYCIIINGDRK